jgi:gliding motility-associated-like protein
VNNGGASPQFDWYLNGVSTGNNTNSYASIAFNDGDVVSLIVTSNAICTSQPLVVSNLITLISSTAVTPSLVINSLSGRLCENEGITFVATPNNSGTSPVYEWTVNGIVTGPITSLFTTSGLFAGDIVIANANALNACGINESALSNALTITAVPNVNAGMDDAILSGESSSLVATSTVLGSISWSPAGTLNNELILNPIATPEVTTEYTISVTTPEGCVGSDAVLITVETLDDFLINSFTPNDDGTNDTWTIKHLELYPDFNVKIFNRWGNLLYDQSGTYVPWDGNFKGKPLPSETYFYVIILNDSIEALKGPVTIVR